MKLGKLRITGSHDNPLALRVELDDRDITNICGTITFHSEVRSLAVVTLEVLVTDVEIDVPALIEMYTPSEISEESD